MYNHLQLPPLQSKMLGPSDGCPNLYNIHDILLNISVNISRTNHKLYNRQFQSD